jgi:hypothetical protein
MPSGERSQVWYPSVVEVLRREWHADLSWDDIVKLRDKLQLDLDRHQKLHGIIRATFRCPDCGAVGRGAEPSISVRAMIIALRRFGIESDEQSIARERAWKRHRAKQHLDLYGHSVTTTATAASNESRAPCAHHRRQGKR